MDMFSRVLGGASRLPNTIVKDRGPTGAPISYALGGLLVVLFVLYGTKGSAPPCGDSAIQAIQRHFVHASLPHLMANLFALYAVLHVEVYLGLARYILLLIILFTLTTLGDMAMRALTKKAGKTPVCSIGFSGILFGLLTWEIVYMGRLDWRLLLAIGVVVVLPTIQNPRASLTGHAMGALAGLVAGLAFKKIHPRNEQNTVVRHMKKHIRNTRKKYNRNT